MNAGSMVRLCATGWHVAHVRPLPPKGSRKNRSAPTHVWTVTAPATTRGSRAQAAVRSSIVVAALIGGTAFVLSAAAADDSAGGSSEVVASGTAHAGQVNTPAIKKNR